MLTRWTRGRAMLVDAQSARGLWVSVLGIGLHDAARGDDPAWPGSPDFEAVCDLAGVCPEQARAAFDRHRGQGQPRARRFAGRG